MSPHFVLLVLTAALCIVHKATCNNPPTFVKHGPYFTVENARIDTCIGNLSAQDIDNPCLSFSIIGDIAKNIIYLKDIPSNCKEKEVCLKQILDYELVDQYSIVFQVEDTAGNVVQKFATLYVMDVNDNKPSFINLPYRAEIPEDAVLGSFVYKVSATDPDTGSSGLVNYNITGHDKGMPNEKTPQGLFQINANNGNVTLNGGLDYETEKFYQLEIMAVDGGGLNSTTDLVINVLDVQDTAPLFVNLPYMASVKENATVGTPLVQVSALDGDRGVPNPVNYTFLSGHHSYFYINSSTGIIAIAKPLDREDPDILKLFGVLEMTVLAQEDTPQPKGPTTATALVTIRILDVNDQIPSFDQLAYNATVLENTQERVPVTLIPVGTEIFVKDMDQGDNGRFQLLVEQNGSPFNVFEVDPTFVLNEASIMIRVKNATALDYETVKSFTFQIIAKEYNTVEKHQNSTSVTVFLEDVNDNWPVFQQENYSATIAENSRINTYVTTVTATDKDTGQFGELTYSLRGGSANLFHVLPTTGQVYVNVDANTDHTLLDREKQDTHYLTVEAVDGGGLRSSVQLQIKLSDENDNKPEIARSGYESYVRENEPELELAIKIQATDIDLPPLNNKVEYSIISGNVNGNFTIDPNHGNISLVAPLDYEVMNPSDNGKYTLVVMARDSGNPALSSTVPVKINVQDVNDETPYFDRTLYITNIKENSTGGESVTTVHANDDDITAPNNDVIYRIESGGLDKFRIDAVTGKITVQNGADLDRDVYPKEYTLKVLAIDRGTPPLTGSATVHINITDVNNKVPVFDPPQQTTGILENTTVGKEFYTYTATDMDLNHQLRYSLLDNLVYGEDENGQEYTDKVYLSNLFTINPSTGTLSVNSTLDRETVERIIVTVFVEDLRAEQPPLQNATAKLIVMLLDVNDNPPKFEPTDVYYATVSEASTPGIDVKQVSAVDIDKNPGPVKYYEVKENEFFEISEANRHTGMITLKKAVDHEVHKWVNITVMAIDSGNPPLDSTAQVHIQIIDVNDNSPVWQVFSSEVHVWENASVGTNVSYVYATDKDSGEFGNVMYFIVNGDDGHFTIDNNTGLITTTAAIDREKKSEYVLTIEARDNNLAPPNEQRKSPGYMTIKLLDINDNAPQFESQSYNANIKESANQNDPLITVRATDRDEGVNGQVAYSIDQNTGNASSLFDVNPETGLIFVKTTSLKGNFGYFHLVVKATDKGTPSLSNTTNVFVYIEDVNDHAPVIYEPKENDTIAIPENVPIGYEVTVVRAIDLDKGLNGQVHYEFVTSASSRQDYKFFSIHSTTGQITTAQHIDREIQQFYYLEVVARDHGNPPMEDRRTITVQALDQDDNPPSFDREKYPPPHVVSVKEENSNVYVANLSIAEDPDIGNNSIICYYIVGGDKPEKSQFYMNRTTGGLWLRESLDRETISKVMLIIKASEDCWSDFYFRPENIDQSWNETEVSTLLVQVDIEDINDNPPSFVKKWFTAGVTKDTQFEHPVIDIAAYTHDPDIGANSLLAYYIQPPFIYTQKLQGQFDRDPFTIGMRDGIVRTNVFFQSDMEGHIEFVVYVNDSKPGHFDRANVSIYLLNENQRVKVIIRGEPEEVNLFKDVFADFLSNVTGVIINVDQILTHKDINGNPDPRRTDMFIHGIDPVTGDVIDADVLIDLIDKNYIYLAELFKTYNVIEVVPAIDAEASSSTDASLLYGVVAIAIVLACLIIVICTTFWTCRRKYKRKLKAATAMAFGSHDKGLNHLHMPGTNVHAYEGSNPIWLEQYENGWPRESDTESKNSLDENNVSPDNETGYDEQEMTVEMQNDEFDQYNKMVGPANILDPSMFLKAALKDHDETKKQNTDNDNSSSVTNSDNQMPNDSQKQNGGKAIPNGVTPNGKYASIGKRSNKSKMLENHNATTDSHRNICDVGKTNVVGGLNLYDNKGFELQATEI